MVLVQTTNYNLSHVSLTNVPFLCVHPVSPGDSQALHLLASRQSSRTVPVPVPGAALGGAALLALARAQRWSRALQMLQEVMPREGEGGEVGKMYYIHDDNVTLTL